MRRTPNNLGEVDSDLYRQLSKVAGIREKAEDLNTTSSNMIMNIPVPRTVNATFKNNCKVNNLQNGCLRRIFNDNVLVI